MSYADIAAHNAPPLSQQPKPDQGLLVTEKPEHSVGIADDAAKVNVVGPNFKKDPTTITGETEPLVDLVEEHDDDNDNMNGSTKRKARTGKARAEKDLHRAEEEAQDLWARVKEQLLRPGVAGGILGVVNVGLLSWASYALYTRPALRSDTRTLSFSAAGVLALLGLEGLYAESYARTPRGQDEARRAKKEGAALFRHSREVVLRPGVLGGLVGALNLGILGGVGCAAYTNWERPRWDRRIVSAVSVGLIALWSGEGFLAEVYREKRHR